MALGYTDTPVIPGQNFRVHDNDRPQPKVVKPTNLPEISPVTPPSDAIVLFDGSDLTNWEHLDGSEVKWALEDGEMVVTPHTGDIQSKKTFGDIQLHLEWSAPAKIENEGQGRGNSGVFLMNRYEIQVLDCYDNPTYADGTTGAIYGQYPPLVNACCPPGSWNVYDILWKAPVFEGESVVRPAYVTVLHNGVMLHHHTELQGPTMHRETTQYEPHEPTGPIQLQDHGNAVRFRNIWVREIAGYDVA